MRRMIFSVFAMCCLFSGLVGAQDLEQYAEKYKTRLDVINAETLDKLADLQQKVLKAMNTLLADEKQQGNLNHVKAVITAIADFDATRSVTEDQLNNAFPKLKRLYGSYQQQVYRIEDDAAQRIKVLTYKYEKALEKLQKELTRQGNLEQATAVQDIRTQLQNDMAQGFAYSGEKSSDTMSVRKDVKNCVGIDLKHGAMYPGLKELLDEQGYEVIFIDSEMDDDVLNDMASLLLVDPTKLYSDEEVEAVKNFVNRGGGLLCAGQAWSWTYKEYGDSPIDSYPLNNMGKAMDFWVTGLNIGAPVYEKSELFPQKQEIVRNGWWPSKIEVSAKGSQVLIRDDQFRPMAGCQPFGKGRIIVYGAGGLIRDNPDMLLRSLDYIKQDI